MTSSTGAGGGAGETAVNLRKSIRGAVNTGSNHPTTYTAGRTFYLLIALTLFLHVFTIITFTLPVSCE